MSYNLTLHAEGWTRDGPAFGVGPVFVYRVGGMPQEEQAKIANYGAPHRNDWRILRTKAETQGEWTGHYESAEEALAALQQEYQ